MLHHPHRTRHHHMPQASETSTGSLVPLQPNNPAFSVRPSSPDPTLLQEAARRLTESGRFGPIHGWKTQARVDRPHSTIFPVTFLSSREPIKVFAKVFYVPNHANAGHRQRRVARRREELNRSAQLAPVVTRALADLPVVAETPLAHDVDSLTIVTAALPGTHLGKAFHYLLSGGRTTARNAWYLLGVALRRIDGATSSVASLELPSLEHVCAESLRPAEPHVTAAERQLIADALDRLLSQVARPGLVLAHGDLNNTNILLERGRTVQQIGLIDFSWTLKPLAFDLAFHVSHLELERPRAPTWTSKLIGSLLNGYGLRTGDSDPAWGLAQIFQYLRLISFSSRRAARFGHRRVIECSRRALADHLS